MTTMDKGAPRAGGAVRAPQDFAAGLFLMAVAALALWLSSDLPLGTMRAMGPGMLPRAIAVLVGLSGLVLAASAFVSDGEALTRWHLRGPILILGAVAVFALTIRTAGLIVAGPASMIIASFATDEVRWKEAVIFSVAMTAGCILLFKVALKLPIPVIAFM
ncbi:tripartite tricarboxylate transporter TctB family protein [uncultured Alsobacter sp.]|uniref:tripartite tricarboxylate transporter TctB family protein n=1 Tax=uncultured Alsobacter sp. TaxID=1748258 RepID=UPI0025DDC358|nr:tripartite tricarboxylate transporter TctB family protein [uncultured Alsobacter sp.]